MCNKSKPLLPDLQTALIQDDGGAPKLVEDVPLPALKPGTVIVRIVAVALNPADHKMGAAFPTPGAIIGMDFSGVVVQIHPETQTNFRIDDRVCGLVIGSNPSDPSNGAFAEYTRARADLLLRVPSHLSMEQAATLGVGLMTNALALWSAGGLALALESVPVSPESPAERPFPVLVYGGSTATGTLATQLLRLSGLDPVVTCSPQNFDLVGARGVSVPDGGAIDYVRPDVVDAIKRRTHGGKLKYAYDCIADPMSVAHCYAALGRTGGRYVSLEIVPEELHTRRAVQHRVVLCYEGLGEDVQLPSGYGCTADAGRLALGVKYFGIFQNLLDQGKLLTHPIQKLEGFRGIQQGLMALKSGSVSGKKLVATLTTHG